MNTTNVKNKINEKKSAEKIRKSSITNKYIVEPIQEENVFDYVKPKKNSFLLFLERNDVVGKLSYNKAERESIFKNILNLDSLNNLVGFEDPKAVIDNFKKVGKSLNSPNKQNEQGN